jgi:hypothetical protein
MRESSPADKSACTGENFDKKTEGTGFIYFQFDVLPLTIYGIVRLEILMFLLNFSLRLTGLVWKSSKNRC